MLIVVGGPMFAGKTTWLIDYASKLPKGSYQLFKPSIDTRYAKREIVAHNGKKMPSINLDNKNPVFPKLSSKIQTILIDELNFFEKNLLPVLQQQIKLGKTIIGAGLMYDFLKKPFGATLHLAKKADKFIELYAICDNCGKEQQ